MYHFHWSSGPSWCCPHKLLWKGTKGSLFCLYSLFNCVHFLAKRPCTKSNHINKDSMRLNLDHILVDLFENGSYLFILQFLDGYDYFACEVTCEKDNDHPPMRAGQHLLQSPFDQRWRSQEIFTKCVANGATEDWLIFLPIYLLVIFCTYHLTQY